MKTDLDKLLQDVGQVADTAIDATKDVMAAGKQRVDRKLLQVRLAKMQQQLGALVYVLRKTGEENEPMIQHYIDEIDRLKQRMALCGKTTPTGENSRFQVRRCDRCGTEVQRDAMFCRCCGAQLS